MPQKKPLTKRHMLGYALGDLGGCMTFGVMGGFMTRYYINVALIDTALLAVLTRYRRAVELLLDAPFGSIEIVRVEEIQALSEALHA